MIAAPVAAPFVVSRRTLPSSFRLSPNVMAPVVLTLNPSSVAPAPASVVRCLSAVVPTTPPRVVTPAPLLRVRPCPPAATALTAASVMAPPLLVSTASTVRDRASTNLISPPPLVVTLPASVAVPPPSTVSDLSAVVPPSAAPRMVSPSISVRPCAPAVVAFTVPFRSMLPVPLLSTTSCASVSALLKVIAASVVWIVPASVSAPVGLAVRPSVKVRLSVLASPRVRVPPFSMVVTVSVAESTVPPPSSARL